MKKLIYLLYAAFVFGLGFIIYRATSDYEGLVEEHYYEKSKTYFSSKQAEAEAGLLLGLPERLETGISNVTVTASVKAGPLRGAKMILFTGYISDASLDRKFIMNEVSSGVYTAEVGIPRAGQWLLRLDIEAGTLKADRRWFARAE